MKSALLILFLRCLSFLPLGAVRKTGAVLGWLCWLLPTRMATTTRLNLALCYPDMPEQERRALGRKSLVNTFQTLAESGPAWLWPTQKVMAHILEVEGIELLKSALAPGRGAVVLAPHLGNWEIFGLFLNNCGCGQSSQLYQAPRDQGLDRMIYQARSRSGARMVATDNKGVAMLLKSLKSGEIVGILPDQVPKATGGEYAPFYGIPVLTPTLAARLWQKTGARAVLGFVARITVNGKAGWRVVFRDPGNQVYAENMPETLAAMNKAIEHAVNDYPEQYQWEYKRFKRVAPGVQRPY